MRYKLNKHCVLIWELSQKYQEESEFRDYVNRYLGQFSSLWEEAKKRDVDGTLGGTLITSDVGKVYILLAKALGREI